MSTMHNIKDFNTYLFEWKNLKKGNKGTLFLDNKVVNDEKDIKRILRTMSRVEDKNKDRFCGTVRKIEDFYDEKDIYTISNQYKLADLLTGDYGYVEFDKIFPSDKIGKIQKMFSIYGDDVGKGEVLLPCLFSDVRMKNREDREKGDCAIFDGSQDNIIYHIEVKSAGSGFTYKEIKSNNGVESEEEMESNLTYNYAYSIAYHIVSRYQKDANDKRETLFIFFDNGLNTKTRTGNQEVKGFWWINVGKLESKNKESQRKIIAEKLQKHINLGYGNTKSNTSSFSISSNSEGIVIHPRKKTE